MKIYPEAYYTLGAVAACAGRNRDTVLRHINLGKLDAIPVLEHDQGDLEKIKVWAVRGSDALHWARQIRTRKP